MSYIFISYPMQSLFNKHLPCLSQCITNQVKPLSSRMPPLHCAALSNNYAVLRYLIEEDYPYITDPDSKSKVSCYICLEEVCVWVSVGVVWVFLYMCVSV